MTDRIDAIAREIIRQHEAGEGFRNLAGDLAPRDMEEAYAAQFRLHEIHAAGGRGPLGGRKIALASKALQELCGLDQPIAGGVFAREILASPAEIRLADHHGLGFEFELAVRLGADIGPGDGPFDARSIRERVATIHPAFEMIIDRGADYSALSGLTMAADNAWCGGVVLGPAIPGWRDMDVEGLTGALIWNGEQAGEARVGDADPFGSLAWVAGVATGAGGALRAGDIVITGSVIRTRAPKAGDHVIYRIGDGHEVEVRVG
ncbi:MAG: 2-keto-4-pentenoate hydratase [Pikeienuella sp.]